MKYPGVTYACPWCPRSFYTTGGRDRHIRNDHHDRDLPERPR